jgi:ABC-type dipeptide/oligopeptide/nickel transport system permease subunit
MTALEGITRASGLDARSAARMRRHPWRAPGLLLPLALVLVLVAAVFRPQWLTSSLPDTVDLDAIFAAPGASHWFGGDQLGRDVFTRVVYGASQSARRRSPASAASSSAPRRRSPRL